MFLKGSFYSLALIISFSFALGSGNVWAQTQPSAFAQGRADQPDLAISADTRTEVIEGVIKRLNDFYVFPEVAKQMETAIRLHWQNKEYDQITSAALLAQTLTSHLRAIGHDKHLEVHFS